MYFGVSNGRYKSSQLIGRGRGPSPLSSGIKQNAPGMFNLRAFLLEGIQRGLGGWGARAEVLKSGFPKIPSTQSFCKEKSSYSLQIFQRKPLSCPSRGRMERGGKKALQERWGSDKEKNKKGVGYCVQVSGSHWSARRDPPGAGTRASFRSDSEPKLPQPWDGVLFQSPVISAWPDAPAGL